VFVEGHPQAAFNTNAPDDLADDYTHATVGERNGHDTYSIHVEDDYEGESNVDVETVANDEYGPLQKRSVRSAAYDSRTAWLVSMSTTPGVAAP
jgi:hypothetical protein